MTHRHRAGARTAIRSETVFAISDDGTVSFALMASERATALSDLPLTYAPIGASLSGGVGVRRWQRRIGRGAEDFETASGALLTWRGMWAPGSALSPQLLR